MSIERIVRIVAGFFIQLSLFLDGTISTEPSWLRFTAFVGANLLQSGFTNLCPLVTILKKLGIKEGGACC